MGQPPKRRPDAAAHANTCSASAPIPSGETPLIEHMPHVPMPERGPKPHLDSHLGLFARRELPAPEVDVPRTVQHTAQVGTDVGGRPSGERTAKRGAVGEGSAAYFSEDALSRPVAVHDGSAGMSGIATRLPLPSRPPRETSSKGTACSASRLGSIVRPLFMICKQAVAHVRTQIAGWMVGPCTPGATMRPHACTV